MSEPVFDAPPDLPAHWPHQALSRRVGVGALQWHVQIGGSGPLVVLLHGTGASAHSWADVIPVLLPRASVLAVDLPGHGFTTGAALNRLQLPQIAHDLDALLSALGLGTPALVVGHSAGAALALRWALSTAQPPRALVGFNPSLVPPPALYTQFMAPLVSPLATSSLVASQLAKRAAKGSLIARMLASTQSVVPEAQQRCYETLFSNPAHVRGTMGFMAGADLSAVNSQAQSLPMPLLFVLGAQDTWVPEHRLRRILAADYPRAAVVRWEGGHVLHEAQPERASALLLQALRLATAPGELSGWGPSPPPWP